MDPLHDHRSTSPSSMGYYYYNYSTNSSTTSNNSSSIWYSSTGHPSPPPQPQPLPRPPAPSQPRHPNIIYPVRPSKSFASNIHNNNNNNNFTWQNRDKIAELASESADSERFGRLVLATLVTLIISLSMVSLVLWVLFGVDLPLFEVGTLSVTKLTVTDSVIKSSWRVNVTVTNPNSEFKLSDDELNATIFYDDHPLAEASILPVYQQVDSDDGEGLQQATLYLEFEHATTSVYEHKHLVEELVKSEETGVLPVSLMVVVGSKFVSEENNNGWSQDTLKVYCGDLKILISRNGDGYLAKESSGKECLTFA